MSFSMTNFLLVFYLKICFSYFLDKNTEWAFPDTDNKVPYVGPDKPSFLERCLGASLRNREVTSNTQCSLLDRISQQRRQEDTGSSEIPNRSLSKSTFILEDFTTTLYEIIKSIKYTLCSF